LLRTSVKTHNGRKSKQVRAGRVHLSPKLPFGWVDFPPSVNRLIGLWWLAKIFYPDHFDEDMICAS
jgi:iron complex transport system substrate-binding protein